MSSNNQTKLPCLRNGALFPLNSLFAEKHLGVQISVWLAMEERWPRRGDDWPSQSLEDKIIKDTVKN